MNVESPRESVKSRRKWWWLVVLVALACALVWWARRPAYIDLDVPFEPADSAWAAKSYITYHERPWVGGGTYYIVRLQGHAREREEKAIDHFHDWLTKHGWERTGGEEQGAGMFHYWEYYVRATHFCYRRKGSGDNGFPRVYLTISRDDDPVATEMGLRMWNVVLESVNPSWLTKVKDVFDD